MRILIADDDPAARAILNRRLQTWGFEVVEYVDGTGALDRLLQSDAPPLAILDWMMPGLDGPEVCRQLRRAGRQTYVLLLTTRDRSHDIVTTLAAGADDHLSKLIPASELRARIQAAARIVALQQQVGRQRDEVQALFLSNPCPMWVMDATTRAILGVNDAACAQYGYGRQAFLQLHDGDLVASIPGAMTIRSFGLGTAACHRRGDGSAIHVEVSECPIDFSGRPAVLVVAQDVTKRVIAERLASLQHEVTRTLAEAATMASTQPRLLSSLGEHLEAEVVEFWEADDTLKLLCGADVWARPGIDVTEFWRESRRCLQRHGSGIAGAAWSEQRPIWAADLTAPGVRERLHAAQALGLAWTLAFPVCDGANVLAVIQLYGRSRSWSDKESLAVFRTLGLQIGQFIVRRRSAVALMDAHEHLRALVAGCPLAIYAFDVDGFVQMWNPAAERVFGWTEAEVLGRQSPIVPPEKMQESLLFRASVLRGEPITGVHVQRLSKRGVFLDVSLSTAPLRDENGAVTGGMSIIQDVTEEKEAERELLDAHDETERLLSAISSVLVGLRVDGRITRWNSAAQRAFGRRASDVLGRTLSDCGIDCDHELLGRQLATCQATREPVYLNDFALGADGRECFLNVVLNPVTAGREAGSIVLLASDVTEYRALQAQLGQSQKLEAIGQLAAGIAHEINTPIQYVGDNVRFLRDTWSTLDGLLTRASGLAAARAAGASVDEAVDGLSAAVVGADLAYVMAEIPVAIDQTLEGIGRVSEIVRAMKEFSHPGVREMVAVDLNHAIEMTLNVSRHEWRYVCDVTTDFDQSLPLVACLPGEFNQVILNLIINAAHAIADCGRGRGNITIRTRQTEGGVDVSVCDTGSGIPEAVRARVFEPFFTTKDVGRGTGQGLALAHNVVVQQHGGRIWFETVVGVGTTFHVHLPREQQSANRNHAEAHSLCR